jgi:glycosyltransferase involved in cell wall biosynthesis
VQIGLIIYGSLETLTGGFFYDRMLVEGLRRQGDEVEVISLPWRSYGRYLGDNFSRNLFQHLRDGAFDVLLQDELNHPSLFWLNQRLRGTVDYPIVTIVHLLRCCEPRPVWQNWLSRWVERRYICSVDGAIWNSQATRRAMEPLTDQGTQGIVAYPGRDHLTPAISRKEVFERAMQPGPLRVLFVGNLSPVKGLHTLVEALSRLPRDFWHLTVVGSLAMAPRYVRYVQRQIARYNLSNNIELLGILTSAQVAMHMEWAQLLVVPSFYEGFGIVYIEGMGFGLPVIASTAGGAGEIVEPGKDGFLVAPGDASSLSKYLSDLIQDRNKLACMGIAAMKRYANHPTWSETTEKIRQFLLEMIG